MNLVLFKNTIDEFNLYNLAKIHRYELLNFGLGDLTFFCAEMFFKLSEGDVLYVKINHDNLRIYKNGNKDYESFCVQYIKYILSDFKVLHSEFDNNKFRIWNVNNISYVAKALSTKRVKNIFKHKFSSGIIISENTSYTILFTKVRNFPIDHFALFKEDFYAALNTMKSKIILLGERNVQYGNEYNIHGESKIYSLYHDFKKNISQDKIIDLSKDMFSDSGFDITSIINDLTLISSSKQIIMIGTGGFWCTSLFTDKLISLTDTSIKEALRSSFHLKLTYRLDKAVKNISFNKLSFFNNSFLNKIDFFAQSFESEYHKSIFFSSKEFIKSIKLD